MELTIQIEILSQRDSWGKNQFNSSFPASLSAFLEFQGFENVYLKLNHRLETYHTNISTTDLYRANPVSSDIFYSLEKLLFTISAKEKSSKLAENCLDVFVWSNLAFAQLFLNVARGELIVLKNITRQVRILVWLFKMLYDFSLNGQI